MIKSSIANMVTDIENVHFSQQLAKYNVYYVLHRGGGWLQCTKPLGKEGDKVQRKLVACILNTFPPHYKDNIRMHISNTFNES